MYMQEGGVAVERMSSRPGVLISVAVSVAAVLIIGIYPQPYISAAVGAFASANGHPTLATTASAPSPALGVIGAER